MAKDFVSLSGSRRVILVCDGIFFIGIIGSIEFKKNSIGPSKSNEYFGWDI